MSNELSLFEFRGMAVRVIRDEHGETWWVAVDVCKVLGLVQVSRAMDRLDDDEKTTLTISTGLLEQGVSVNNPGTSLNLVNEPGLYSLILTSRKPEAKAFKRWVVHEVLPAIRRTGRYSAQNMVTIDWNDPLLVAQLVMQSLEHIQDLHKQLENSSPRLDASLFWEGKRPPIPTKAERMILLYRRQMDVRERLKIEGYANRLRDAVAREMGQSCGAIQRAVQIGKAFDRMLRVNPDAAAKVLSGHVGDAITRLHKTDVLSAYAFRKLSDRIVSEAKPVKVADLLVELVSVV